MCVSSGRMTRGHPRASSQSSRGPTTGDARPGRVRSMKTWTATATAEAHPAAVLHVLTDPDAASRWAPVPFDVEDDRRLAAGRSARVSGRFAGQRVGFDVHVHAADLNGFALSARGPVGFD